MDATVIAIASLKYAFAAIALPLTKKVGTRFHKHSFTHRNGPSELVPHPLRETRGANDTRATFYRCWRIPMSVRSIAPKASNQCPTDK
jgi:hypothetical protein